MSLPDNYEIIKVSSTNASVKVYIDWPFDGVDELYTWYQNSVTGEVFYQELSDFIVTVNQDGGGVYATIENTQTPTSIDISIARVTPKTQTYTLLDSESLNPVALIEALDKHMKLIQEIARGYDNQNITSVNPFSIPDKVTRANKIMRFDANGDLELVTLDGAIDDAINWSKEWAINPEDVLVSADAGGNQIDDYSSLHHAAKAAASSAKAEDWADESEDTEVEPGRFSAMHWAIKAQNSAASKSASNLLINPRMIVNQRVFTGGALGLQEYFYDRWKSTDAVTNVTKSGSIITLSDGIINQVVETDHLKLTGRTLTFSLESAAGSYEIDILDAGNSILATSSGPSVSHAFTGEETTVSVRIRHISGSVTFTSAKLEYGQLATDHIDRLIGEEVALCQRYFEKSYNINVDIGAVTLDGLNYYVQGNQTVSSAGSIYFKERKRVTPSIAFYAEDGSPGVWLNLRSGGFLSMVNNSTSEMGFAAAQNASAVSDTLRGHWTAECEL